MVRSLDRIAQVLWCLAGLVLVVLFLAQVSPAQAAGKETVVQKFDHLLTGFPLEGQHALLKCETCHVDGDLEGLPTDCAACHDNIISPGKPVNHLETPARCNSCHNAESWLAFSQVDHNELSAACVSCHNGSLTTGKDRRHINATDICNACHTTIAFTPAYLVDHEEVLGSCSSCHDGRIAPGKRARHVFTNRECDACHDTTGWSPAGLDRRDRRGVFDHSDIDDNCASCHNGERATGQPQQHLLTTNRCEACHTTSVWAPAVALDHNELVGSCANAGCHQQPVQHIATTQNCVACHATVDWLPVIAVDHMEVLGNCTSAGCHTLPVQHINSSLECAACHSTRFFIPVIQVDHNEVAGSCVSCHDANIAVGKSAQHIASSDVCDACHTTIRFQPVLVVDHDQVIGLCANCHNGVDARGKSLTHIPTTDDCGTCHTDFAWVPAAADHGPIIGNCIECHNGVNASGKGATHVTTTDVCEACHDKFPAAWVPVAPERVDHTQVRGICASCHDNVRASGKSSNHLPTSDACEACHQAAPVPWTPVAASAVDHAHTRGQCSDCHNNVRVPGKSANHIASTDVCDACHQTGPAPWQPVPAIAVDHNQVIGSCVSCHNNSPIPGKSAAHMATTENCEACHQPGPIPWTPVAAAAVNHDEVIGTCSGCHNNSPIPGAPLNHCPTLDECDACHSVASWLNPTQSCTVIAIDPVADPGGPYATSFAAGRWVDFIGNVAAGTNPNNLPVEYLWEFPDGTTSNLQNPRVQIFLGTGSYTVSLTVTLVAGTGNLVSLPATTQLTITMM